MKNFCPKGLALGLKPKEASLESVRKATYRVKLKSLQSRKISMFLEKKKGKELPNKLTN